MQNTDKKKDFLKSLEDKKVSNVVFKPEGLGALEFDIVMTGKNFETTSIPFRIERISTDSFLKFLDLKSDIERAEKILLNFIAFPVEARDKEYFNLDMEAMTNISTLIVDFQQTPFLYIERKNKQKLFDIAFESKVNYFKKSLEELCIEERMLLEIAWNNYAERKNK